MVFVPLVLVVVSPCANPPSSFPKALVQMSGVAGSLASVLYLVMVSPVSGWTMPAPAKCSMSGIEMPVGCLVENDSGAYMLLSSIYTWCVMKLMASWEMI